MGFLFGGNCPTGDFPCCDSPPFAIVNFVDVGRARPDGFGQPRYFEKSGSCLPKSGPAKEDGDAAV
jgi:hypothetical protein